MATLDKYKLSKGESNWHEKVNGLIDAVSPTVENASQRKIKYGTSDDPTTSGWNPGDVYFQIES